MTTELIKTSLTKLHAKKLHPSEHPSHMKYKGYRDVYNWTKRQIIIITQTYSNCTTMTYGLVHLFHSKDIISLTIF